MSDLIDRQDAIDAIKKPHGGCYTEEAKGWAVYQILSVPSAQKTGRWEKVRSADYGTDFRCSACHRYRFHNGEMRNKYIYCPNCGAKMEEETE